MATNGPHSGHGTEEQLRIELEDAASVKWWARILYTLGSQYGRTQLRFVGKAEDGRRLYTGDTFPGPPLNRTPPEEAWHLAWRRALPGCGRRSSGTDG